MCENCGYEVPSRPRRVVAQPPAEAPPIPPPTPESPEPPSLPWIVPTPEPLPAEAPSPPLPRRPRLTRPRAVFGLLCNLVLPGWGSWIGLRKGEGGAQLFLVFVGLLTAIYLIGLAVLAATWAWGVVTGIQLLVRAFARRPPQIGGARGRPAE